MCVGWVVVSSESEREWRVESRVREREWREGGGEERRERVQVSERVRDKFKRWVQGISSRDGFLG